MADDCDNRGAEGQRLGRGRAPSRAGERRDAGSAPAARDRRRRLVAIAAIAVVAGRDRPACSDSAAAAPPTSGAARIRRERPRRRPAKAKPEGQVSNATPQADWEPHTGPVPILEYHVLGRRRKERPYPELYVGRPDFRQQMDWLEEQGYEAVTLEAVEEAWYHGGTLPAETGRDLLRRRLPAAVHVRPAGAAQARLAGLLNLKAEGSELYERTSRR